MASEGKGPGELDPSQAHPEGEDSSEQLAKFVEELMGNMQQKFQQMSEQIIGRLDDMGKRVDDLEKNIGDLMQQVEPKDESPASKK